MLSGIEQNWSVRTKVPIDNIRIIDKGVPFYIGSFKITSFGVPHDSSDNVGYCIEHEGVTFVLMTDIGHLTDEMKEYIGLANYLVIEADYEKEMLENKIDFAVHSKQYRMRRSTCSIRHSQS